MPLRTRIQLGEVKGRSRAKSRQNKDSSPDAVGLFGRGKVASKIDYRLNQVQQALLVPSSGKYRRKNMYSVLSCRALLKKAKEVDVNDPSQTFLPPSKSPFGSGIVVKTPMPRLTRVSGDTCSRQRLEFPRILLKRDILQTMNSPKLKAKSAEERYTFDEKLEEPSSFSKLIHFGVQESISFKPLQERISNGGFNDCLNLLDALKENQDQSHYLLKA